MSQEQERYTHCDRCGKRILEQCAIEQDGLTLCSDCVMKETNRDVGIAEKKAAEVRKKTYEIERKETLNKQKKRAIIVFIVAIVVFGATQWFMVQNRPEPTPANTVDIKTDLPLANAMIVAGINKYFSSNKKVPNNLKELSPQYMSKALLKVVNRFEYLKLNDQSYELNIIPIVTKSISANQSGKSDEHK